MARSLSLLGWKDICGKLKPGILDALEQCPPTLVTAVSLSQYFSYLRITYAII